MSEQPALWLLRPRIAPLVIPTLVLVVWQVLGLAGALPTYIVSPTTVVAALFAELFHGDLLMHAAASMYRVAAGLLIGTLLGVVLGLLSGTYRVFESFFDPLVAIVYPVPKIVFLPIFMVWVGIGDESKILTIATSVFFPAFINSYYGARSARQTLIWVAQNMGTSRWGVFWGVIFPSALPQIFTGLRVVSAIAFIIMFSAEFVSSRSGLGFLVIFAEQFNRYDQLFAALVAIALLGFVTDRLVIFLRRRVLHYLPEEKEVYG